MTKTKRVSDQTEATAPTDDSLLWVPLEPVQRDVNDEVRVTRTLVQYGFRAIAKGARKDTYDLEVLETPSYWPVELGPRVGRYEVKKLARSGKNGWDPRFKTSGARGSRMYGRTDALIKAASLEIESLGRMMLKAQAEDGEIVTYDFETSRLIIDGILSDAFTNRHSRKFQRAFNALCLSVSAQRSVPYVKQYLDSPFRSETILDGYADIDGLFIIRGDTYTLIKRDKILEHIGFDSYGCEGLKLRIKSVVSVDKQRSGKR